MGALDSDARMCRAAGEAVVPPVRSAGTLERRVLTRKAPAVSPRFLSCPTPWRPGLGLAANWTRRWEPPKKVALKSALIPPEAAPNPTHLSPPLDMAPPPAGKTQTFKRLPEPQMILLVARRAKPFLAKKSERCR
jgi:hypothetical protein